MSEVVLVLPYPISANRYWRTYQPKGFKSHVTVPSSEAKSYKQEVGWLAKQAGVRSPMQGRVEIDIKLFPQRPLDWAKRAQKNPGRWDDDVRCIDLDNARKVLYDSLKGIVFDDDRWVFRDSGQRMEPDGEARVVVTVRQIAADVSPQGALL